MSNFEDENNEPTNLKPLNSDKLEIENLHNWLPGFKVGLEESPELVLDVTDEEVEIEENKDVSNVDVVFS